MVGRKKTNKLVRWKRFLKGRQKPLFSGKNITLTMSRAYEELIDTFINSNKHYESFFHEIRDRRVYNTIEDVYVMLKCEGAIIVSDRQFKAPVIPYVRKLARNSNIKVVKMSDEKLDKICRMSPLPKNIKEVVAYSL